MLLIIKDLLLLNRNTDHEFLSKVTHMCVFSARELISIVSNSSLDLIITST